MSGLISFLGFGSGSAGGWAFLFLVFFVALVVGLIIALIVAISLWKIFSKAGKPGWTAFIPLYSYYIEVQIAGLPVWYFIVGCIPVALALASITIPYEGNTVISLVYVATYCVVVYNLAKRFGKGVGYTLGMIFLPFIFYPMLAFGDAVYQEDVASLDEDVSVVKTESVPTESASVEISAPDESPTVVNQAPTATT